MIKEKGRQQAKYELRTIKRNVKLNVRENKEHPKQAKLIFLKVNNWFQLSKRLAKFS